MTEQGALRGAQSVYRAISILETFRSDRPALTLVEIAEAVDLTVPTTHRLLRALQSHDLVVFDDHRRQYSLGAGVMRLASVILNRDDVLAITQPGLQRLRESSNETVALHWRVDDHRVCLLELVSNHPIRMASGVGNAYPLVAGASGKAILAHLSDDDIDEVIGKARADGSKVQRKALLADLADVRERGFAMSFGETVAGAAALATPLLDASGRAIAALNVTGPVDRLTEKRMAATVPELLATGKAIMDQLGYSAGQS